MEEKQSQFRIMKKGYDRFAVDDAILDYENQVQILQRQVDAFTIQMKNTQDQLQLIKINYQHVLNDITVKEKAAENISKIALREANTIIETAHNNANSIVREALSTARLVLVDIVQLSSEAAGMKDDMKKQLESLTKNIDEFELPPIPDMDWLKGRR